MQQWISLLFLLDLRDTTNPVIRWVGSVPCFEVVFLSAGLPGPTESYKATASDSESAVTFLQPHVRRWLAHLRSWLQAVSVARSVICPVADSAASPSCHCLLPELESVRSTPSPLLIFCVSVSFVIHRDVCLLIFVPSYVILVIYFFNSTSSCQVFEIKYFVKA